MKPDIILILNKNPRLRKFLQENYIPLSKIISITENILKTTPTGQGTTGGSIRTGEVVYIIKGDLFTLVINSEKDVLRMVSSD